MFTLWEDRYQPKYKYLYWILVLRYWFGLFRGILMIQLQYITLDYQCLFFCLVYLTLVFWWFPCVWLRTHRVIHVACHRVVFICHMFGEGTRCNLFSFLTGLFVKSNSCVIIWNKGILIDQCNYDVIRIWPSRWYTLGRIQ